MANNNEPFDNISNTFSKNTPISQNKMIEMKKKVYQSENQTDDFDIYHSSIQSM